MGSLIKKRRKRMRKKKHKKMLKRTRWQRRAAGKQSWPEAGKENSTHLLGGATKTRSNIDSTPKRQEVPGTS